MKFFGVCMLIVGVGCMWQGPTDIQFLGGANLAATGLVLLCMGSMFRQLEDMIKD